MMMMEEGIYVEGYIYKGVEWTVKTVMPSYIITKFKLIKNCYNLFFPLTKWRIYKGDEWTVKTVMPSYLITKFKPIKNCYNYFFY